MYIYYIKLNKQRSDLLHESAKRIRLFKHFRWRGIEKLFHLCYGHYALHYSFDHHAAFANGCRTKVWRMEKQGEMGRKKLAQVTRYGTVVLAFVQAIAMSIGFNAMAGGQL